MEEVEKVNEPSINADGSTKQFWAAHSISPKKLSALETDAPKTPKELEARAKREREKERLNEMGERQRNPKIARPPATPKPKPFTKKQVIPLIAPGTTD